MNRRLFVRKKLFAILFFSITIFMASSFATFADEISFELPDSLQVTHLKYYVTKAKGKEQLIFELKVKNVSSEDHRYRMRISLKDETSAGMLVPRKGKPPVIKAGKEENIKLPFIKYAKEPEGILVTFIQF